MVGVRHRTRRKDDGKNLGRKHLNMDLSERRRASAREKQRGKRVERKVPA